MRGAPAADVFSARLAGTGTGVGSCGGGRPSVVTAVVSRYVGESGKTRKCNTYACAKPLLYTAGPSIQLVPKVAVSVRAELLYGPIYAGITAWTDLFNYKRGVYVTSQDATADGGHAVSVLGWGTADQTEYWVLANSWGTGWGERGYFRATDALILGKDTDLLTINSPAAVPCADRPPCQHGDFDADCNCVCDANWRAGGPGSPTAMPQSPPVVDAACDVCTLECVNNGVLDAADCSCACPQGYLGTRCSNFIMGVWDWADFKQDAARITVKWDFDAARWLGPGRVSRFTGLPAEDSELLAGSSLRMAAPQGSLSMPVANISLGCAHRYATMPYTTLSTSVAGLLAHRPALGACLCAPPRRSTR